MKTVLKFYRKYVWLIVSVFLFLLGQVICELALPGYMADMIDKGIAVNDTGMIIDTGTVMLAVSASAVICSLAVSFFSARTATASARDLRSAVFRKVMSMSSQDMETFSTASLITRTTNDIYRIQQTSIMILRLACYAPFIGIGAVIRVMHTSAALSWTIGVALVLILVIMTAAFFLVFPKFKLLQSRLDKLNLIIKERLSGLLVIRAFGTEKSEQERFSGANDDLMKLNMFVNRAMSFLMPLLMFVMNSVSILIIWAGTHLIEAEKLMVGDMLAYLQYAMQVIMAFLFITMMFIMLPRAAVSVQRVSEVLDKRSSINDPEDPSAPRNSRGTVEFRHVSFTYPDALEKTLDDITFTAEPGKTTAVIGGTGSGKSTLMGLIPRFYDVTEGQLLIDGTDVRDMTQHELRKRLGYVPQESILFTGTIGSNLRFGRPDADDEEIGKAADIAQASGFIKEKEKGFDDEIAHGGRNVSGGQRQRLSIARALVRRPEIYIFDDTFSALDLKTDKELRKAFASEAADSTVLIVAQRINTIIDADQIIVLDEGRIAGCGTHSELMRTCSVYKEIALSQLSAEELESRCM